MKLREKTAEEIQKENHLSSPILTNVVEEKTAKDKMRATSMLIAKALVATLGPYGSSTIIQDSSKQHFATKDGYDLMNKMQFEDDVSRTILDLFKTTAGNQVFSVGDGSTSAIIVANALFQALTDPDEVEHFKRVAPKDIVDILNDLSEMIEAKLKEMAIPVSDDMHELDIIAAVANNNDEKVGHLVADIYRKIGEYGFISMETNEKQEEDSYEIKSGVEWDRGYIDPLFSKLFGNDKISYSSKPRIIISNSNLTYNDIELVLIPLMKEAFKDEGNQLLIVANDFDSDVLTFLKNNRSKHLMIGSNDPEMDFTAVDIDQTTTISKEKLEDLALLCDCKIYDKVLTQKADIIAHPDLYVGRASKIIVSPKNTQVVAIDDQEKSVEHIKKITSKLKEIDSEIKKLTKNENNSREEERRLYNLKVRRSRLLSSSAVIHVGGKTLTERVTRQRLIEDSVFATKSAMQYGYIPGGNICIPKILLENKEGFCSVLAAKYKYLPIDSIHTFFSHFINVVSDAFLESYRAVLNNSYMSEDETEKTINKCLEEGLFYNLKLHKFEKWNETHVINSTATDLEILRSCISIISILATSNQFMTIQLDVMSHIKPTKTKS